MYDVCYVGGFYVLVCLRRFSTFQSTAVQSGLHDSIRFAVLLFTVPYVNTVIHLMFQVIQLL